MINRKPLRICNALGGSMPVIKSETELSKLKDLQCPPDKGGSIWLPIFKEKDNWVDNNEKPVTFLKWGDISNLDGDCAVYFLNEYIRGECSYSTCFYCQL